MKEHVNVGLESRVRVLIYKNMNKCFGYDKLINVMIKLIIAQFVLSMLKNKLLSVILHP